MSKDEFLLRLEEALGDEIPKQDIDGHIKYYREYLSSTSDGKSEDDKVQELGDPRLIAKTIIATAEIKMDPLDQKNKEFKSAHFEDNVEQNADAENIFRTKIFSWDDLAWYQKIIAIIIGILIVLAIIAVFIVGVNIFFSLILPVLIIAFVIKLIVTIVRR